MTEEACKERTTKRDSSPFGILARAQKHRHTHKKVGVFFCVFLVNVDVEAQKATSTATVRTGIHNKSLRDLTELLCYSQLSYK